VVGWSFDLTPVPACALALVLAFNSLCFHTCASFNAMEQRPEHLESRSATRLLLRSRPPHDAFLLCSRPPHDASSSVQIRLAVVGAEIRRRQDHDAVGEVEFPGGGRVVLEGVAPRRRDEALGDVPSTPSSTSLRLPPLSRFITILIGFQKISSRFV
jgi:hypothetical protein